MPLLASLVSVLVVNLILSGDNAVVVGMAARGLPPRPRRRAIVLGSGLAVALRLVLTLPATLLLRVPLLRAGGGLLLGAVAYRLLSSDSAEGEGRLAGSVAVAVRLIVLADLTMSLDNVLAVAAVADRSAYPRLVLVVGLALSIPLVLAGGALVARLLVRLPILAWLGAALLAVTAAGLVAEDRAVERVGAAAVLQPTLAAAFVAVVVGLGWWRRRTRAE